MIFHKLLSPLGSLFAFIKYKHDRLRLVKLMHNGLKVGRNVYISHSVTFDHRFPFLIEIGDNCRISAGTIILAHDATVFRDLGITRLAPVKILDNSFIGINTIILPGVTIGPNAVISAGSVVNRDIGEGKIAAGNPARPYGNYVEIIEKYKRNAKDAMIIREDETESEFVKQHEILTSLKKSPMTFICGVPSIDPYYVNTDIEQMRRKTIGDFERLMNNTVSPEDGDQEQMNP